MHRAVRPIRAAIAALGATTLLGGAAGVLTALRPTARGFGGVPAAQRPLGAFSVDEVSGLVASRRHPGVFWAIRDSGNPAALYAIRLAGGRLAPWPDGTLVRRVAVTGARNVDWEEVTTDDRGQLWIADSGNNSEGRTDLALYRVPEPDPFRDRATRPAERLAFRYPDRPTWGASFDAEALFFVDGGAYLIAKSAGEPVYRFPPLGSVRAQGGGPPLVLARLTQLTGPARGFGGLVSGAAIARDGRRLAVVGGNRRVWVYEAGAPGLTGDALVRDLASRPPAYSAPFAPDEAAWQVEAVSFSAAGHDVVLAAEEGPIWRFPARFYEGDGGP